MPDEKRKFNYEYSNPRFRYNPFGGLQETERSTCFLPIVNLKEIATKLKKQNLQIVEFLGDHGRGKTEHLVSLSSLFKKEKIEIVQPESKEVKVGRILFIDRSEKRTDSELLKWAKEGYQMVLSTHRSKEKLFKPYPFESILISCNDAKQLCQVFNNRIKLAAKPEHLNDLSLIEVEEVEALMSKYQDDVRAILNHLYKQFQKRN